MRSISASPCGQWLASGSDDGTVRVWEVVTGRCMKTLEVGGTVKGVAWNPSPALCLLAVAVCVSLQTVTLHDLTMFCHVSFSEICVFLHFESVCSLWAHTFKVHRSAYKCQLIPSYTEQKGETCFHEGCDKKKGYSHRL